MTTDSVGVIIPEVIRTLGLSLTAAGTFQYATMTGIAVAGLLLGSLADRLLLYCYHYDPQEGNYGFVAMRAVRIGGAVTIVALVGFVFVSLRSDYAKASSRQAERRTDSSS